MANGCLPGPHNSNQIPSTIEGLRAAAVPPHLFLPPGIIIPEDQVLLYLLARVQYQGTGEIVDAGVGGECGILVGIEPAVLVEIDPAIELACLRRT